jgi:hypothetical protein
MTLEPNALTTFQTVQDELGLTDSDFYRAARLIGVASAAIESYCQRSFRRAETSERYEPSGANRLQLRRTPIVAVASIAIDGVATTEWEIEDSALGWLWRESRWKTADAIISGSAASDEMPGSSKRAIVVTYTAGFVLPKDASAESPRDLPLDLEQACIETVASLWRQRGVDRNSAQFAVPYLIPTAVLPILKRYLCVVG